MGEFTVTVGWSVSIMNVLDFTAERLPAKSLAIHLSVTSSVICSGSGSARARFGFHSVEFSVGVEPSSV